MNNENGPRKVIEAHTESHNVQGYDRRVGNKTNLSRWYYHSAGVPGTNVSITRSLRKVRSRRFLDSSVINHPTFLIIRPNGRLARLAGTAPRNLRVSRTPAANKWPISSPLLPNFSLSRARFISSYYIRSNSKLVSLLSTGCTNLSLAERYEKIRMFIDSPATCGTNIGNKFSINIVWNGDWIIPIISPREICFNIAQWRNQIILRSYNYAHFPYISTSPVCLFSNAGF